jgi:hypothetical protein
MVLVGRPQTIAECEELIVRIEAARADAYRLDNAALILEYDDKLIQVHAILNALIEIPRQRTEN